MKKLLNFVMYSALIFGTTVTVSAQRQANSASSSGGNAKIIICEDVNDQGQPINPGSTFTIPKDGGYVHVQVDNGGTPLRTKKLVVDIYLRTADYGDWTFVETKEYTVQPEWDHPDFKYTFYVDANFRFVVKNDDGKKLGEATCKVNMSGSDDNSSSNNSYSSSNRSDYSSAKVVICEDVSNGEPVNESSVFSIPASGGYVYVLVQNNGKPLHTSKLVVDVYLRINDYGDWTFVETKEYTTQPEWDHPSFKYTFYVTDYFKFVVKNDSGDIIGTATCRVKSR